SKLGRAGLPHIALLADPCYGGVTASYPMVADVILAEPGAMIGFAGPRVIEQTIRESLPEGFQTAEFLLEHGMIDAVVERKDLPEVIGGLLKVFNHGSIEPEDKLEEESQPETVPLKAGLNGETGETGPTVEKIAVPAD